MFQVQWLQLQLPSSLQPEPGCESVPGTQHRQLHSEEGGREGRRAGQSHPPPQTADREQAEGESSSSASVCLALPVRFLIDFFEEVGTVNCDIID